MQRRKLNNQTNSLQARRQIKFYYERKKLCDKCDLCNLSPNEINENYDDILKKIKLKNK